MRYQGDQVASVELEARWQCYGRWSVVPFAGFGATHLERSVGSSTGQSVGSGGVGFRYELARKFGLHAGMDVAHSPGTTAVYIQVGNAVPPLLGYAVGIEILRAFRANSRQKVAEARRRPPSPLQKQRGPFDYEAAV